MDGAGNLYGTTAGGGNDYDAVCGTNHGCGVVFELTPTGTGWRQTVIYAFCPPPQSNCYDGANPYAGLTMDGAGNLYGTTANAGFTGGRSGNVFELMPIGTGWSEKFLYLFCSQSSCADGASPHAGLIMDAAGHLFGTTNGVTGIPGTFFKLAFTGTGWIETVLHSFSGADGIEPSSTPLMDAAGNFYGTTYQGGNSSNAGAVFTLAPAAPTTLSVSLLGPGTVTSLPAGINCPATCSAGFAAGAQVSLSQTPASGWSFEGWDGACSGRGGCDLTMNANESVMATFWTDGSSVLPPSATAPAAAVAAAPMR